MATTTTTTTSTTTTQAEQAPPKTTVASHDWAFLHLSSTNETPSTISIWKPVYNGLCTVILHIIHFAYLVYITLSILKNYIQDTYSSMRYDPLYIHDYIRHDKEQLTKLPKHLSITISREFQHTRSSAQWQKIMDDVCIASCWAWEFGIEEFSVYDASGVLKSMSLELTKRQSLTFHEWMKDSRSEKPRSDIRFTILAIEDGKAHMGHVAQKLITQTHENIDINTVDKYMHDDNVSDPDLMIVYDGLPHNYVSLDGYLPWHIRLTEFVNCSSQHRLDYALFSKCLYKYSKLEQRFGR